MTKFRPEDQLLLDCLRFNFGSHNKCGIESSLDWEYLLDVAGRHRVVPLLYLALRDALPYASSLAEEFDKNALQSLKLSAELKRVLKFLEVPSIPFKGPTLAVLAYGNVSYRQFSDLDLLIHKHDFCIVKEALLENGYVTVDKIGPDRETAVLNSHHHYRFYNSNTGAYLEVHWEIAPKIYSFPIKVSELFRRSRNVKLFGQDLLTLSPEDAFLVLSEHGTRHYWNRLAWICDVAKLCELELDWTSIFERAKSLGIKRAMLLAISLARIILGSRTPGLLPSSTDKAVPLLAKEVEDRLFSRFSPIDPNIELFYIRARERYVDKLRYYAYRASIPTEDDWNCIELPGSLFPLYCLIRPARLINKYRSRVVRWLR
jgi:hypothetical protein